MTKRVSAAVTTTVLGVRANASHRREADTLLADGSFITIRLYAPALQVTVVVFRMITDGGRKRSG